MNIKKYKSVIDSDVSWLSEIPKHWKLGKIKNLALLTPSKPSSSVFDGKSCSFLPMEKLKLGKVVLDEERPINEVYGGYTYFANGDLLLAKVTPCFENKNMAIAEKLKNGVGFGSSEIYVLRTKKSFSSKYLYYRLQEDEFMRIAKSEMTGAGGLKRVPSDFLLNFKVAIPPKSEQQKIAQFLDYETAKIDALIDEQKRLIELLKEKRQAVISHAVTKGLNPDAPMKDSGVEWLGEVPEYWNIVKLKYLIHGLIDTEHKTVPFDDEGEFFVARTSDIRGGKLDLNGAKRTNQSGYIEWTKRGAPKKGDIIFTREAPAGEACIVPVDDRICLGQRTVLIKLNESSLASGFALWSLYGGLASRFITELSQGSTVSHINMADIPNIPVLLPSLDEQKNIDAYLKSVTDKYDSLKAHSEQLMARLHERRSALISAAVTGKIDVRDWQPPAGSDTVDSNASVQTERHYG